MNKIITAFKLASAALIAQKTRSILTILGVSIGIAVVITILAAGRGLDRFVMGQLDTFSPDTIAIETKIPSSKKMSTADAIGQAQGVTITSLKEKDLESVRKNPNIIAAYGFIVGQTVVKYDGVSKTAMLMGEGYQMPEVQKFVLDAGRMYTKDEEDSLSQVTVLGAAIKKDLFGEDEAVGKTIYFKSKPFRVVGVAAKQGAYFGMDMDKMIVVPAKTLQKRVLGIDYYREIITKMADRSKSDQTVAELAAVLRENHDITDPNKEDFTIHTMAEAATMLDNVVKGITFLLVALVCVSLIVGGVGVMNIMYVSVTERTFEIGLRKSLGATNSDILWQFLMEAMLLTLAGAVVGVILGAILSLLVYLIAIYYNFLWVYAVPLSGIILSISFSAAVGLFFGLYPAKKAAALNPIEALRRE